MNFEVVGSATFLVVLIVVMRVAGLFDLNQRDGATPQALTGAVESLSSERIEELLHHLEITSRRVDRCRRLLEAAREAAARHATTDEILEAAGMRAARRAGQL